MLDNLLKVRSVDGKVVMRPNLTFLDLQCATVAFAVLKKFDRLARGTNDASAGKPLRFDDRGKS